MNSKINNQKPVQLFFNFIWKIFCYDKNDSKNFRLRVVRSFFDEDEVRFKYSTNKGLTWNYIYVCVSPIGPTIDYDYTWGRLTFSIQFNNIEYIKSKFPDYKSIKEYHEKERSKYIEKNKSMQEQRKEYKIRNQEREKWYQEQINKFNN